MYYWYHHEARERVKRVFILNRNPPFDMVSFSGMILEQFFADWLKHHTALICWFLWSNGGGFSLGVIRFPDRNEISGYFRSGH